MTDKNLIHPERRAASPFYREQLRIFAGNKLGDDAEEVRYLKALAQTDTGAIYHLPYFRYYFLGNNVVYQDSNVMLSIPPEYHYLRPFLVENSALKGNSEPDVKLRFCNKHGSPLEATHFREVHEFLTPEIKNCTVPLCTNIQYLKTHTSILQDVTPDNATNASSDIYADGPIYKLMGDSDSNPHEKSVYIYDISSPEASEVSPIKVGKLFNEGMVFKMCEDGFSLIHLRDDMHGDDSSLKPSVSLHVDWKEVLLDSEESFDVINSALDDYPVYLLINGLQTSLSKDLPAGSTLVDDDTSLALALLKQVKFLAPEGSDALHSSLPGKYAIPIHVGHVLENAISSDYEGISARKVTVILKESEISLSPREEKSIIPIFLDEKQQFIYAPCVLKTEGDNLITLCDTTSTVAEPVSYSSELLRSFTKKHFSYYISGTPSYTHLEEVGTDSLPQNPADILLEEPWEDDLIDEDQWEMDGDYVQLWSAPVYVESADARSTDIIPGRDTVLSRKPRDVSTELSGNRSLSGSVFIGKAIPLSMDVLQDTRDVLYYVVIALQNGIEREISPYGYFFLDELLICRNLDGTTVKIPPKYQFLKAIPTHSNTGDIRYKFVFSDKDGVPITPSGLEPTHDTQNLDGKLPGSVTDAMPYVSGLIPDLTITENSGPTFSVIKQNGFAVLADNDGKEVGRLENNLMFLRVHRDSNHTPKVFLHLDDEAIAIPLKPTAPTQGGTSAYLYLSPSGLSLHVGPKMLPKATLNATLVKSDKNLQNFTSSLEDFLLHGKLPSEGSSAIKLSLQQIPDSPNLLEVKAMLRKDIYRDLEVANGKLLVQKSSYILIHTSPDQEPRILCSHVSDLLPVYVPRVDPDKTDNNDSIITLKKGMELRVRNSTLLSELRNIPTHYTLHHESESEILPVEPHSEDNTEPETNPLEPPVPDKKPAVSSKPAEVASRTEPKEKSPVVPAKPKAPLQVDDTKPEPFEPFIPDKTSKVVSDQTPANNPKPDNLKLVINSKPEPNPKPTELPAKDYTHSDAVVLIEDEKHSDAKHQVIPRLINPDTKPVDKPEPRTLLPKPEPEPAVNTQPESNPIVLPVSDEADASDSSPTDNPKQARMPIELTASDKPAASSQSAVAASEPGTKEKSPVVPAEPKSTEPPVQDKSPKVVSDHKPADSTKPDNLKLDTHLKSEPSPIEPSVVLIEPKTPLLVVAKSVGDIKPEPKPLTAKTEHEVVLAQPKPLMPTPVVDTIPEQESRILLLEPITPLLVDDAKSPGDTQPKPEFKPIEPSVKDEKHLSAEIPVEPKTLLPEPKPAVNTQPESTPIVLPVTDDAHASNFSSTDNSKPESMPIELTASDKPADSSQSAASEPGTKEQSPVVLEEQRTLLPEPKPADNTKSKLEHNSIEPSVKDYIHSNIVTSLPEPEPLASKEKSPVVPAARKTLLPDLKPVDNAKSADNVTPEGHTQPQLEHETIAPPVGDITMRVHTEKSPVVPTEPQTLTSKIEHAVAPAQPKPLIPTPKPEFKPIQPSVKDEKYLSAEIPTEPITLLPEPISLLPEPKPVDNPNPESVPTEPTAAHSAISILKPGPKEQSPVVPAAVRKIPKPDNNPNLKPVDKAELKSIDPPISDSSSTENPKPAVNTKSKLEHNSIEPSVKDYIYSNIVTSLPEPETLASKEKPTIVSTEPQTPLPDSTPIDIPETKPLPLGPKQESIPIELSVTDIPAVSSQSAEAASELGTKEQSPVVLAAEPKSTEPTLQDKSPKVVSDHKPADSTKPDTLKLDTHLKSESSPIEPSVVLIEPKTPLLVGAKSVGDIKPEPKPLTAKTEHEVVLAQPKPLMPTPVVDTIPEQESRILLLEPITPLLVDDAKSPGDTQPKPEFKPIEPSVKDEKHLSAEIPAEPRTLLPEPKPVVNTKSKLEHNPIEPTVKDYTHSDAKHQVIPRLTNPDTKPVDKPEPRTLLPKPEPLTSKEKPTVVTTTEPKTPLPASNTNPDSIPIELTVTDIPAVSSQSAEAASEPGPKEKSPVAPAAEPKYPEPPVQDKSPKVVSDHKPADSPRPDNLKLDTHLKSEPSPIEPSVVLIEPKTPLLVVAKSVGDIKPEPQTLTSKTKHAVAPAQPKTLMHTPVVDTKPEQESGILLPEPITPLQVYGDKSPGDTQPKPEFKPIQPSVKDEKYLSAEIPTAEPKSPKVVSDQKPANSTKPDNLKLDTHLKSEPEHNPIVPPVKDEKHLSAEIPAEPITLLPEPKPAVNTKSKLEHDPIEPTVKDYTHLDAKPAMAQQPITPIPKSVDKPEPDLTIDRPKPEQRGRTSFPTPQEKSTIVSTEPQTPLPDPTPIDIPETKPLPLGPKPDNIPIELTVTDIPAVSLQSAVSDPEPREKSYVVLEEQKTLLPEPKPAVNTKPESNPIVLPVSDAKHQVIPRLTNPDTKPVDKAELKSIYPPTSDSSSTDNHKPDSIPIELAVSDKPADSSQSAVSGPGPKEKSPVVLEEQRTLLPEPEPAVNTKSKLEHNPIEPSVKDYIYSNIVTSLPESTEKSPVVPEEHKTLHLDLHALDAKSPVIQQPIKSEDRPVADDQKSPIKLENTYDTQGLAVPTLIHTSSLECTFPPLISKPDTKLTDILVREIEIVLPENKIHPAVQSEGNSPEPSQPVTEKNPQQTFDTTVLNSEENVAYQHELYTTSIQNELQLPNLVASLNAGSSAPPHSKSTIQNTRVQNANSVPSSGMLDALFLHNNINLYEGYKMISKVQPGRIISSSPHINKYHAVSLNADGTTIELSPYKYQVLHQEAPNHPMLLCETAIGQKILIDKSFFFLKAITEFHDGYPMHRLTFCDATGKEISPSDVTYLRNYNLENNSKYNSPEPTFSISSLPEPLHNVLISNPTEYAEHSIESIVNSQGDGPTFEIKVDNDEFGIYKFNGSEKIGTLNSRLLYFSTVNGEDSAYFLHDDTNTSKLYVEPRIEEAPTTKFLGITPEGVVIYSDRSATKAQITQVAKSPEDCESFVKAITSYLLRGELPKDSMAVEFTTISLPNDKSRSGLSDIHIVLDNAQQLFPIIGGHKLLFSENIFGILYISEDTNEGEILCDNAKETILGEPVTHEQPVLYGANASDTQHIYEHQPTQLASVSLNLTLNDKVYTNLDTNESLFPLYAVKKLSDIAGPHPDHPDTTLIKLPVPQYVSVAQDVLFLHPENRYTLKLAPEHTFAKITYDGIEYALTPCDKNGISLSKHTDFSDSPDTYCNSGSRICSQVFGGTKEYSKFLLSNGNLNFSNYTEGITSDEIQKSLQAAYEDQMRVGSPYFFEIIAEDKHAYLKPITSTKVPLATTSALLYVDGNYRIISLVTHSNAPSALLTIDLLEEKHQPLVLKARKNVLQTHDLYAITDGKYLLFSEDPTNAHVTYNEPLISKLLQSALLLNPSEAVEKFSWDEFYALKIEATDIISNNLCSLGIKTDSGVLVLPTISENGTTLGFANDDLFKLVYKIRETDFPTKDFRNLREDVLKEIFQDNASIEIEYDELQHTSDKATFHILGNTLSTSEDISEDIFRNIQDVLPKIRDAVDQHTSPYEPLYHYLNRLESAPTQDNDVPQKSVSTSMPIYVDTFREMGDLSVASVFTINNDEKVLLPSTCYYFLDGQLTIRDIVTHKELPAQIKYLKIVHHKDTGKPVFAFCDEAGNEYGDLTKLLDTSDILLDIKKEDFDLEKMHSMSAGSPVFSLEPSTANAEGISGVALFPTYKNYLYSQSNNTHIGNLVTSFWAITEDTANDVDYKDYEGSLLHVYYLSPRLQNFSQHVVKWDSRVQHVDSIPYKLTLLTASALDPLYITVDGDKVALSQKDNVSTAAFLEDAEFSAVLRESCGLLNDKEKFTFMLTLRENGVPHAPHYLPISITKIDTSTAAGHKEYDTDLFLDIRNYTIHLVKNQQDVEVASTTPWSSVLMNAVLPNMLKIEVSNDEEANLRSYKLVCVDNAGAHLPKECEFFLDKLIRADESNVPDPILGMHTTDISQSADVTNPEPAGNAQNTDNTLLEWTDSNLHHVFTNLPAKSDTDGSYPLWIHANYNDVLTFYQNINTKYQTGEYSYDEALVLYDHIVLASCNNETFCVPYGHIDHVGNVLVGEHHFGHIEGVEKMFNMLY